MILPEPGPAFDWIHTPAGSALVCRPLERVARHLFTSRPWSLGSEVGAQTESAWSDVASAVEIPLDRLLRARQVHGAAVLTHRVSRPLAAGRQADIIAGDDPWSALAIQTADCVPLLIGDSRTGAVAAVHAGWRGTALRVAAVAVEALVSEFGSRPSDLVAAVGPSIGPCCYQVGRDVHDRFLGAGVTERDRLRWFSTEGDRFVLDLWTATRDQLESAGVARGRIHAANLCTATHRDVFCSYRRDGARAGRLAAVIRTATPRRASEI